MIECKDIASGEYEVSLTLKTKMIPEENKKPLSNHNRCHGTKLVCASGLSITFSLKAQNKALVLSNHKKIFSTQVPILWTNIPSVSSQLHILGGMGVLIMIRMQGGIKSNKKIIETYKES